MDSFAQKVKDTIDRHGLLRDRGRVIVAISGGADSVALLAALAEAGYDCVGAHCNFHLRGAESQRDMHHVEAVAAALDVDLYVRDFDVAARRRATGESVEMACRSLRYEWFYQLLDRDNAQAIAVGHHREDQVETFFLNLLRGTGMAGLGGMRLRSQHVVRPLLECSRAEIEGYLQRRSLTWVDDSSNAGDDFLRNRLRHHLLPLLEELKAGAADRILHTMELLREGTDLCHDAARRTLGEYAAGADEYDLWRLAADQPMAPALLYEFLKGEGYNRSHTDAMLRAAAAGGGSFTAKGGHTRDVDHGMLRAPRADTGQPAPGAVEVSLLRDIFEPVHIAVTRHHVAEFAPERTPNVIYIDERALHGIDPWQLRPWCRGDRMRPYGMDGSKLVSDLMAQAKLSAAQKQGLWLLTRGDDIVWAVGLRASSLFTVKPGTRQYLRLEYLPQKP